MTLKVNWSVFTLIYSKIKCGNLNIYHMKQNQSHTHSSTKVRRVHSLSEKKNGVSRNCLRVGEISPSFLCHKRWEKSPFRAFRQKNNKLSFSPSFRLSLYNWNERCFMRLFGMSQIKFYLPMPFMSWAKSPFRVVSRITWYFSPTCGFANSWDYIINTWTWWPFSDQIKHLAFFAKMLGHWSLHSGSSQIRHKVLYNIVI